MDNEPRRIVIHFRCSDRAYDRLFRRRAPERDGGEFGAPGERFDEVLKRFCDQEEGHDKIVLEHPKSDLGRNRKVRVDPGIKARFDAIAARSPVGAEVLIREAIWRFTKST